MTDRKSRRGDFARGKKGAWHQGLPSPPAGGKGRRASRHAPGRKKEPGGRDRPRLSKKLNVHCLRKKKIGPAAHSQEEKDQFWKEGPFPGIRVKKRPLAGQRKKKGKTSSDRLKKGEGGNGKVLGNELHRKKRPVRSERKKGLGVFRGKKGKKNWPGNA